jgi:hypothetical protein
MTVVYKGKLLINLEGNFKAFWDYLQLVVILYISMTAPFKVAFVEDYEYFSWDIFDHFMDFLVLIDVILVFFTPFYANYLLITSHAEIAKSYLKLWF